MNKLEKYFLNQGQLRISQINTKKENGVITIRLLTSNMDGSMKSKLGTIEKEVRVCEKCDLYKTRNKTVFGKGSDKPSIVFVGEAPGADEDMMGLPFVGRGGRLLDIWIAKYDLTLDNIYIMNALKCRPPKNRDPLPLEKDSCRDYFERQMDILKPKVICALGKHGFSNLVIMDSKDAFGKMRKKIHYYNNIPVIATYHPAYILRNPSAENMVFEDFDLLMNTLKNLQ